MPPGYMTSSKASSPQSRSMTGGDGIMMIMNSFDVSSNGHAACARRHRTPAQIRSRSARPLELVRVDRRRAPQLCLLLRHGHRVHGHASKCTSRPLGLLSQLARATSAAAGRRRLPPSCHPLRGWRVGRAVVGFPTQTRIVTVGSFPRVRPKSKR